MAVEESTEDVPVKTLNEWAISYGRNMDNHTAAIQGTPGFIRQGFPAVPIFRHKQAAYRYAAYLVTMAEMLPDEEGEHTFDQVLEAIRNT